MKESVKTPEVTQQVAQKAAPLSSAPESHDFAESPDHSFATVQLKKVNNTGLPENLKSGMENLSGMNLNHVKVHYNSPKPATVQAHAYAQGSEIHLAAGQEKHLPHELGHVVQQMNGRVKPTRQLQSKVGINDDPRLEADATRMGERALQRVSRVESKSGVSAITGERAATPTIVGHLNAQLSQSSQVVQLVKGDESETQSILGRNPTKKEQLARKALKKKRDKMSKAKKKVEIERERKKSQKATFDTDSYELSDEKTNIKIDPYSVEIKPKDVSDAKGGNSGILVKWAGQRSRDLAVIDAALITKLMENATWYLDLDLIWAVVDGHTLKFNTSDILKMERALCIRHLILNEEAQPRSGKGRAAPAELAGTIRVPAKDEASYSPAKKGFFHSEKVEPAEFKATHSGDHIEATIIHKSAWAKGVRDPGQSDVMGGQNAKNYIVDTLEPAKVPASLFSGLEQQGKVNKLGGRWEWLHLIGSSLGGVNTANNLVAGSYDANTKMIALEHRVANWGTFSYDKEFKPTADNPIEIKTTATVNPKNSHVGNKIKMVVKHGAKKVVEGEYEAANQTVITKKQYEAEEERVAAEIDKSRTVTKAN
ncbi:MAG: DUF4157 domain-containing protein [Algicola sp.]|nr:DUF4157 domain-containing protein [Algicola sp.]